MDLQPPFAFRLITRRTPLSPIRPDSCQRDRFVHSLQGSDRQLLAHYRRPVDANLDKRELPVVRDGERAHSACGSRSWCGI